MRFAFLMVLIAVSCITTAQDINNSVDTGNYYRFFSVGNGLTGKKLTTGWLNTNDVLPIILEEMKIAKHKSVVQKWPYKIDTTQVVTLLAYSKEKNIGFLYSDEHDMFPSKKHRQNISQTFYRQFEDLPSGESNFVTINKAPDNIIILNGNLYWYQYTENPADSRKLVTKQNAISILRKDIQTLLSKSAKNK